MKTVIISRRTELGGICICLDSFDHKTVYIIILLCEMESIGFSVPSKTQDEGSWENIGMKYKGAALSKGYLSLFPPVGIFTTDSFTYGKQTWALYCYYEKHGAVCNDDRHGILTIVDSRCELDKVFNEIWSQWAHKRI